MESMPTPAAPPRSGPAAITNGVDAIPVLEARETSGITSNLVLTYADRHGGPSAVAEILRRCGLEDREAELRDDGSWFSFATKIRLFEAAACGASIISDNWPGLDTFFLPGSEILLPAATGDVRQYLNSMDERIVFRSVFPLAGRIRSV